MKTKYLLKVVGLVIAVTTTSGCHLRPNFLAPPGDKDTQRGNAVLYDPFPDADAGPTIEGGRPLGYQHPVTNTSRVQMTTNRRAPGAGF